MKPEFIEFETKDGLTLPGLLYRKTRDKTAVIYLHGNGSSSVFYDESRKHKPLVSALAQKNISILYFNNRGAHIMKRLNVRAGKKYAKKLFGMAYEKIKECVYDIDGAIHLLKKRGYNKFYLVGASTGASKICVYNFYKPKNNVAKYVLLCGGDDTGIYYDMLGRTKFWKTLTEAKKKISSKKGEEIITDILPEIFSYSGFFDIANPDGDYNVFPFYEVLRKVKLSTEPLFRYFLSIKKPSLVVYGDRDEFAWGNVSKIVDILKSYQPGFAYRIIKGADHGFKNKENQLAKTIADWL